MNEIAVGIEPQDPRLLDQGAAPGSALRRGRKAILGTLATAAVAGAALAWAKWYPYALKIPTVAGSHSLGDSVLSGHASAPPSPSWNAAVEYALDYLASIWQALVAGLLVAAAVEAFLPARRLLALFQARRGPVASTVCGGLLSMSSMMCTCCAAPVALNVRRRGVPVSSALAYWLGNPVLNPATLAFMAFVLPWQFVVVRIGTGAILVFGVTLLVSRLAKVTRVADPEDEPAETGSAAGAAPRFAKALARLAVRLLPEYAVVVLLLGGFRGWLFPEGSTLASWGLLAAVLLAVVGTLFVIPTAAEIPIIGTLIAAGVGMGPLGGLGADPAGPEPALDAHGPPGLPRPHHRRHRVRRYGHGPGGLARHGDAGMINRQRERPAAAAAPLVAAIAVLAPGRRRKYPRPLTRRTGSCAASCSAGAAGGARRT